MTSEEYVVISSVADARVLWGHDALRVVVDVSSDGLTSACVLPGDAEPSSSPGTQSLVEALVCGEGRARSSHRFSETAVGQRLRFAGSASTRDGHWHELTVDLRDEVTGLRARTRFRSPDGVAACQVVTEVTHEGERPVTLLGVTSLATGFPGCSADQLDLVWGDSEWLGECRWERRALREGPVVDLSLPLHGQGGRGGCTMVSTGTWSTGQHLPIGGIVHRGDGPCWLWQVEHNGAWRWEIGERSDGLYLALLGPTDVDHQWRQRLAPGQRFTTVPVSIAVASGGLEAVTEAMTRYRRALVRPHPDRSALPVVFNDYMNTLMGDPTTARLLPLIDASAQVGAEVFCVDAGWYDDGSTWWDSVGEWLPSRTRFPGGIEEVVNRIRRHGMVPGLWLEPEVIGVRSRMADRLPAEAFLQRDGIRVVEDGRYHLDLRHPAAVAHLDEVVDRLVDGLGIGYLKLDYNIDPGAGTDLDADSVGAGLLGHNRAHLAWLDSVLDRHPQLTLENCASGGMRMDYALLSRVQLQSTSDQQDQRRYPPIASAVPLAVLPEQAANWAYPQPDMSDEEIAHTLCTGMLGRLYLSGRLDAMGGRQLEQVRQAVAAYRTIRCDLAEAVPRWPLGLPGWTAPWTSLALVAGEVTYLGVWRQRVTSDPAELRLPWLRGREITVEPLYPRYLPEWGRAWDPATSVLTIVDPGSTPIAARILRIVASPDERPIHGVATSIDSENHHEA